MEYKLLILLGRTFVATFLLVNFFNLIPLNFSSNAWYVQSTMLLVDTSSLLLLGLCCLKFISYLYIKNLTKTQNNQNASKIDNTNAISIQKYRKNLNVINNLSKFFSYFFVFVAIFQIFIILNGSNQLHRLYSDNVIQIEKKYQINNNNSDLNSKADLKIKQNFKESINSNLIAKDKIIKSMNIQKNRSQAILLINALKVFLMSLVWAYGFLKLYKFS